MMTTNSFKTPKWVYRIESNQSEHGLWYNADGEWTWDIGKVPGCETKDLPMGYDERYRKDGKAWFSSCSQKEDLTHWFSRSDVEWLKRYGFAAYKYLAREYVEYKFETTFIKETCLDRHEISLDELFGK